MTSDVDSAEETLVTKSSLALSLSPPRFPPHGSAHRALLLGQDPVAAPAIVHHHHHAPPPPTLQRPLFQFLRNAHLRATRLPHPHLSVVPDLEDRITRWLGAHVLPVSWQNAGRDSGTFRRIADWLVTCTAPTFALSNPSASKEFIKLTRSMKRIRYGDHPMQIVDLYFPDDTESIRGLLFFVHGGAWGSGLPWFYRLVASPFLERSMVVAIVGYRTYPCANVQGQVEDLELASREIERRYPNLGRRHPLGTCFMGHSSGAHIALLYVVDRAIRKMQQASLPTEQLLLPMDSFVGISGPYDICHHFDYEAGRGVEEISPMKPACGYSRDQFRHHSPPARLVDVLGQTTQNPSSCFPRMALVHGIEDATVPFTATAEAARTFRNCGIQCSEIYLPKTEHQEAIMQVMLGGRTRTAILDWLEQGIPQSSTQLVTASKL